MAINIGIADLEAVLAVRRCGSFRAAAEALSITQPSVSARVQHAEALLGVVLFHRTTRKVSATPQGERLCEYAERALYDLKMLTAMFRDEAQLRAGKILVGATPTLSATRLACTRNSGTATVSQRVPRRRGPSASSHGERRPPASPTA